MCTYQNRPNMVCSLTKNRRIKVPASTWFYYIPKKIPRLRSIPRGMYTYRNRPRYLHKPIGMFLGLGSVLNIKMIIIYTYLYLLLIFEILFVDYFLMEKMQLMMFVLIF